MNQTTETSPELKSLIANRDAIELELDNALATWSETPAPETRDAIRYHQEQLTEAELAVRGRDALERRRAVAK